MHLARRTVADRIAARAKSGQRCAYLCAGRLLNLGESAPIASGRYSESIRAQKAIPVQPSVRELVNPPRYIVTVIVTSVPIPVSS